MYKNKLEDEGTPFIGILNIGWLANKGVNCYDSASELVGGIFCSLEDPSGGKCVSFDVGPAFLRLCSLPALELNMSILRPHLG